MPILDDGGIYTHDKGKREITDQEFEAKPLQLKNTFFFRFYPGTVSKKFKSIKGKIEPVKKSC